MGAQAVFVFIGGGFGAITREFLMLLIPQQSGAFPLDIFTANVVASFCLGAAFGLHRLGRVSDEFMLLVGTGFCGGMSTFSSFVFGVLSEATAPGQAGLAVLYGLSSLAVGYAAVRLGILSGKRLRRA
ncbi:Putative fluoride ion transporter CrcB [Methylorubrum aminovorans]|uniref:Fluoride-specific ion channel FluC n=1 Tax=Methylorubrum aminovorans TaxID=269069 RepID=A0ABQ4UJY0_9HYPH|nr:fluoride efflux transporter CrcB [Methylorubrum aminovorans]GJE66996.1 Putative fluoride ion transporter CrcB [Methylorubrum aminovorans]GMA77739.1 putative fluoride ion transporter CrcB [Methylorubrum aminovorans]